MTQTAQTIFIGMGVMTLYTIIVLSCDDEGEIHYLVSILIAYIHSTLIVVSIACAFFGAYMEKPSLMLAGGIGMILGIDVYIIASVLSYLPSTYQYACIGNRCPDHVWLQESYWRYHYLIEEEEDGSLSMKLRNKDREEHYTDLPRDLEVEDSWPTAWKRSRVTTVSTTTMNLTSTSLKLLTSTVSTTWSTERTSTEAVVTVEPTTVQETVVDYYEDEERMLREQERMLREKERKLKKKAGKVEPRLEVDSRRFDALGSNAIPGSLIYHTNYSPLGGGGESSTQKLKTKNNRQAKGTLSYAEAIITITSRQKDYDLLEIQTLPTIIKRRMRDVQSHKEVLQANGILKGKNDLPYFEALTTLDSPRKVIISLNENNAIKNALLNIKKPHVLNITSHNRNNLKKIHNENSSDRIDWIKKRDLNISVRFVQTLLKHNVNYGNLENANLESEANSTESKNNKRSQDGLRLPYKYVKHPTLDLVISIIFNISYLAFLIYTAVIYFALYDELEYGDSSEKESFLS